MKKTSLTMSLSLLALLSPAAVEAAVYSVTVDGPDAIFLAGRTDITIPNANLPWFSATEDYLSRHGGPTPEEAKEQMPSFVSVSSGDVVRALDPAVGGVNFFNGFAPPNPAFGPGGNGLGGSNLQPLGGISGYIGPQGPLVGVFLNNSIPNGAPPPTLDFSTGGLGIDFLTLSPALGQIFYIGDGKTSGDVFQEFTAPAGATRLFLGIPDGFGFVGHPGAYDDNDGAYRVQIGVNEVPTNNVPEGGSLFGIFAASVGAFVAARRKLQKQS